MVNDSVLEELKQELKRALALEVRTDLTTRLLYSTDASIYQIEPLGVVFPRNEDELAAVVEIGAALKIPLLARGSGSSLAGQAIGAALILDCSRFLNRLVDLNQEERTATVEPGLILTDLNRAAAEHGLGFGPDPASAERATLGGSIANNATGAHSIIYGMAADHLLSADVVLSDGSLATFEQVSLDEAGRLAAGEGVRGDSIESRIYRTALQIRQGYAGAIHQRWPRTWRRASGYNINYLMPWSPTQPPQWTAASSTWSGRKENGEDIPLPYPPVSQDSFNLAALLAGSEGTLAVIRRMTLRLVPLPRHTILGVLSFSSLTAACDAVPSLLELGPSAIELIPYELIRLARSVPAYAHQLDFVQGDPTAMLVVEFAGDDPVRLKDQALSLGSGVYLAESLKAQNQVWTVRKVGLGLLNAQPGDVRDATFIEDLSVPVDRLGEYVREMERIFAEHGVHAEFYAHASAGCLHIRPMLNLKTVRGVEELRAIATQAISLTLQLGGSVSGEHGDGIARSEWLERMYGEEITRAFHELKASADPDGLLNPGKIIDPPRMDEQLRYGPDYIGQSWQPALDFSREAGLQGAIELCNGAGVCRKSDGVMCPSFQATQEEMHSTRGRANLLRAMISGRFPTEKLAEQTVYEALDLCLACKGCKAECPSSVDMAKLKYEFTNHYYENHPRKLRDYMFAYIDALLQWGHLFAPLANPMLDSALIRRKAAQMLGLAPQRPLPCLAHRSFFSLLRKSSHAFDQATADEVIFLLDTFTAYLYPEAGMAALGCLAESGCRVRLLPVIGAGRTLISKGFLEPARRHANRVVEAIARLDPQGKMPIVGVEPSEVYTLREDYLDLLPEDPRIKGLASRAYMIDEFLVRPSSEGEIRILRIATKEDLDLGLENKKNRKVLLHGHCYQKAQPPAPDGYPVGVFATVAMLEAVGYQVQTIKSGCCGMAGAFGYEAEHYALSSQVAELALLPAVRAAEPEVIIAASGVSCQEQIGDGTSRKAVHPITLV